MRAHYFQIKHPDGYWMRREYQRLYDARSLAESLLVPGAYIGAFTRDGKIIRYYEVKP